MDKEEYPSDSDQSDEDFCPENIESDDPSEEESDGNCEESDGEHKQSTNLRTQQARKKLNKSQKSEKPEEEKCAAAGLNGGTNEVEEKRRSDALWADFLSDVNESTDQNTTKLSETQTTPRLNKASSSVPTDKTKTPKETEKVKVTEIFEFAGEEIKVTRDVPVEKVLTIPGTGSPQMKLAIKDSPNLPKGPLKRPAGGLSSVLSSINKKNKISVLEKSKLDWNGFKQKEGLSEELQTFNKGRDGYLERQDFLERTDLRQFEIEKSLRQTKRSNR